MPAKVRLYADQDGYQLWGFHCPGCGYEHTYRVGVEAVVGRPCWSFNGNLESPTFTPSLLCNPGMPDIQCHLFVTDGQIVYQSDCWHSLAGKTVDMEPVDA